MVKFNTETIVIGVIVLIIIGGIFYSYKNSGPSTNLSPSQMNGGNGSKPGGCGCSGKRQTLPSGTFSQHERLSPGTLSLASDPNIPNLRTSHSTLPPIL